MYFFLYVLLFIQVFLLLLILLLILLLSLFIIIFTVMNFFIPQGQWYVKEYGRICRGLQVPSRVTYEPH